MAQAKKADACTATVPKLGRKHRVFALATLGIWSQFPISTRRSWKILFHGFHSIPP